MEGDARTDETRLDAFRLEADKSWLLGS